MKAIAVFPGQAEHDASARSPPRRRWMRFPDGRGVLVKVLRVGVDGTDKEINAAEYGAAPPGFDYLITGHESFGRVVEVGPNVTELAVGRLRRRDGAPARARASTTRSAPTT